MMSLVLCGVLSGSIPDDLSALLSREPRLTGSFTQTRALQGFKRPLVSKGTFTLRRGDVLLWTTQTPFSSTLEVRPGTVTTSHGSREVLRLDAERQPAMKEVTQVLFAALGGDIAALEERFVVEARRSGDGWTAVLTPRTDALRAFLVRLELEGDRYVKSVRILQASGETSRILLSDVHPEP